jgi:hypothetical protein
VTGLDLDTLLFSLYVSGGRTMQGGIRAAWGPVCAEERAAEERRRSK